MQFRAIIAPDGHIVNIILIIFMICTGDSGWHIAVPPTPFHYMHACDLYNAPAAPGLASNLISGCSFKLHIAFVCNVHLINQSILHLFRYTIITHTNTCAWNQARHAKIMHEAHRSYPAANRARVTYDSLGWLGNSVRLCVCM